MARRCIELCIKEIPRGHNFQTRRAGGLRDSLRVFPQLNHRVVENCEEEIEALQLRDTRLLFRAQLSVQAASTAAPGQG